MFGSIGDCIGCGKQFYDNQQDPQETIDDIRYGRGYKEVGLDDFWALSFM